MRKTLLGIRIAVLILISYWLVLFVGTHIPAKFVSALHSSDKLMHTLAYAGLGFLLAWALPFASGRTWIVKILLLYLVGTVYAILDELTQIPVGRTADWRDFIADQIGLVTGLAVYSILRYGIMRRNWRPFSKPTEPQHPAG